MNIENHATFGVEASVSASAICGSVHQDCPCLPVVKRFTRFSGCYITTNHVYYMYTMYITFNHRGASSTQVMGSIAATNVYTTVCTDAVSGQSYVYTNVFTEIVLLRNVIASPGVLCMCVSIYLFVCLSVYLPVSGSSYVHHLLHWNCGIVRFFVAFWMVVSWILLKTLCSKVVAL